MNKLDALFKEKLSGHPLTPSTSAWEKLESGLTKKNDGTVWMRWAAAMVPVAAASLALLISNPKPEPAQHASAQTNAVTIPSPTVSSQTPMNVQAAPIALKSIPRRSRNANIIHEPAPITSEAVSSEILESIAPLDEITIEPTVEHLPESAVEIKPMVLVYTLESIAAPVADADDKKSKLVRVVEFAKTVKHSDPLGDFRTMKDELLAIDLRKKTTKKN